MPSRRSFSYTSRSAVTLEPSLLGLARGVFVNEMIYDLGHKIFLESINCFRFIEVHDSWLLQRQFSQTNCTSILNKM